MKKVFIDTNVALSENFFPEDYDKVKISIVSIEELDGLKKSQEIGHLARKATNKLKNSENVEILLDYTYSGANRFLEHKCDNLILGFGYETWALDNEFVFLTDDYNLFLKAKAIQLPCELFDRKEICDLYTGYKNLSGGTYFINELFSDIEAGNNKYNFVTNEYAIIYNEDLDQINEYRFNGTKLVDLKLPPSKTIKGQNSLQRCALDMLYNKDIEICVVAGTVGSGKTYLSTRMAVHHVVDKGNYNKVLAVREAIGEGKEVGFLKGTFEDKTKPFFAPIVQSLSGGEFEFQSLVQRGVFEAQIPFYMKGTTYPDTIIVVDEAEDLSKKQLKLIGTRLGDNSRVFFSGDYKQSAIDCSERNPLIKLCSDFKGKSNFACVFLDEDIRSEASKTFAEWKI